MIRELTSGGARPVLERMLQFTGLRQRLIAHNIANLDTPDFRQRDLSPALFQGALRDAIDRRRSGADAQAPGAPLALPDTRELRIGPGNTLVLRPGTPSGNILYHDRNNRDLEGLMQDLAENQLAHRLAIDLLRRESEIMRTAISQRV